MGKIDKSKLPEVHIDIGSHNMNPVGGVQLPDDAVSVGYRQTRPYHHEQVFFSRKNNFTGTEKEFIKAGLAYEFSEPNKGKRIVRAKNPAPRIGTAHPRRKSQITGKSPSPRLVARRQANTRKGYFPNPVEDAGVKLLGEIQNAIVAVNTPTKLSSTMQNDLTKQARLSYAQGLITAGYILNVIDKVKRDDFMLSLKHSYQGQK